MLMRNYLIIAKANRCKVWGRAVVRTASHLNCVVLLPNMKCSPDCILWLASGSRSHIYEFVGVIVAFHFGVQKPNLFKTIQNTIQAFRPHLNVRFESRLRLCPSRDPDNCPFAFAKPAKVLAIWVCSQFDQTNP